MPLFKQKDRWQIVLGAVFTVLAVCIWCVLGVLWARESQDWAVNRDFWTGVSAVVGALGVLVAMFSAVIALAVGVDSALARKRSETFDTRIMATGLVPVLESMLEGIRRLRGRLGSASQCLNSSAQRNVMWEAAVKGALAQIHGKYSFDDLSRLSRLPKTGEDLARAKSLIDQLHSEIADGLARSERRATASSQPPEIYLVSQAEWVKWTAEIDGLLVSALLACRRFGR